MRTPEFWARDGLRARLLAPAGQIYGLAGRLRRALVRPQSVDVPVICVGNLVAGGAGKTPTVLALARRLAAAGHRPHLLCRGYGGRERGPLRIDPLRHDAAEVGDEALLLAEVAPTWVARDRLEGARAAVAAGAGLLIQDDGLQNPALAQDLRLVVVDGGFGFGNRRLLPAGPLREPIGEGLARVSAVIRIGADQAGIDALLPAGLPRLEADLAPDDGAPSLAGRRVLAFAGIGRPEKFFGSLESAGAEIVQRCSFADHHPYRRAETLALLAEAERLDASCITTAKDRVRLPLDLRDRVLVLPVVLRWRDSGALDRLLATAVGACGRVL
jgi:tetraacyldisaccharide 4'-kinase